MNKFETYCEEFTCKAQSKGLSSDEISFCLDYANVLYSKGVPVIYNQEHLANLLGMPCEYILQMSNRQDAYYTEYRIPKKHGGERIINEPYPDLKKNSDMDIGEYPNSRF